MFKAALLILLFGILYFEINFQVQRGQLVQQVLAAETERSAQSSQLIKLHNYWKKIVTDSPTYRDGYVQLALVDSQLGDQVSTAKDIQQIFIIDPNYQPSSILVSLLPQVFRR